MKEMKESMGEIVHEHRGVLGGMILLAVLALGLLIFSVVTLHPGASVVKVGYGDIGRYQGGEWSSMSNSGGYRDGTWVKMLAFPILAVILGVVHNLMVVKVYKRQGAGVAALLLMISILLVIGGWLVLLRLLGEG